MFKHEQQMEALNERIKELKRENAGLKQCIKNAHADGYRAGTLAMLVLVLLVAIFTVAAMGLPALAFFIQSL